jgi:nucleoside-diphosphate-sugar epimerase
MKVLVTGAGSLLLGGVAQALAERGDEVVCVQRRKLVPAHSTSLTQYGVDIRDREALTAAAVGCDAIIHGAARVGVVGTWEDFRSVNVDGTANVIHAARTHGIARLVYVSTPSVAHSGESIVGATADVAVTGRKGSFYAESKAQAEHMALAANTDGLGVVSLRPHLVWGPGDTQLVGRIVDRARAGRLVMVGNGHALVDSTYIDNAISAHLAALDAVTPRATCAGRAYVIANGEPRTVTELIEGICQAAGVPFRPKHLALPLARIAGSVVERLWPRLRSDEPPLTRFVAEQLGTAHWFDPRPARDDLAWSPHVTLDEGFTRLRAWFELNR